MYLRWCYHPHYCWLSWLRYYSFLTRDPSLFSTSMILGDKIPHHQKTVFISRISQGWTKCELWLIDHMWNLLIRDVKIDAYTLMLNPTILITIFKLLLLILFTDICWVIEIKIKELAKNEMPARILRRVKIRNTTSETNDFTHIQKK